MDFQPTAQPLVAGWGWSRRAPVGLVGLAGRVGLRRGRCKYVHVSSIAASMRLTPLRSPTRPASDTFRRFRPPRKEKEDQKQKRHCGWLPGWTSPLPRFDLTDLIHAWRGSTVSTKVDTQSMRLTPLRSPTRPASDTFRRFRPPRKEKEDQKQKRHSGRLPGWTSPLPRFDLTDLIHAWRGSTVSTKVDTHGKSRFANRHRETVEGGEVSDGGVSAAWARGMPRAGWAGRPTPVLPCAQESAHEQAAAKPPRMGLRRPRHPTSPRLPTEHPRAALALALALASAGAGCNHAEHPPLRSPGMARRYP